MNSSPEPDQNEAVSARQRLISAAGPIFAARGYDASLREIAAEAGVNVAAVSYYFGDKMGLYRAVIEQIRVAKDKQFAPPPDIGQIPAGKRLELLVRTILSRVLSCHNVAWEPQIMMREMMHPTAALEDLVHQSFEPLFELLKQTVTELFKTHHGESANFQKHVIEQTALSIVGQCLYYRVGASVVEILIPQKRRQQKFDIETLANHITRFTLSAISNPNFSEPLSSSEPDTKESKIKSSS